MYHHVKLLKPSDNAIERGLTILPAQFAAQLRFLASNRYHVVTALQFVNALCGRAKLPSKPVVLTFDDGYSDVYADVYQILRRRRLGATFFIVPGFLGTPRYLTWNQVRDMAAHGMDIEAHTLTHPDLTTLSPGSARQEIARSREVLQGQLHHTVRLMAYPYGAYNAAVLADVAKAGYLAAFTTHQGWSSSSDHLFQLPRVYVDLDDTISIFAGRLRADSNILAQDPT